MKRLFFLSFLLLSLVLPGQAQERVRNVRIRAVDAERLEILYDLANTKPGDSVYIEMKSRLRGSLRILPEFVRGDIGTNVTPGTERKITWDALANGYRLDEEVQAKIFVKTGITPSAKPVVTTPIATQPPTATPSKSESVVPKPEPTKSVVVTESKPAATAPSAVTLTPPPSKKDKRTVPPKPSIFAADPDTDPDQPEPEPATVVKAPVPVPQKPMSQTVPAPVVQTAPPVSTTNTAVVATDTVPVRKTRYIGPAWALLSAVAPGVGNIFVQTPKPKIGLRPLLAVGCYGLIAYGLMERKKAQDGYAIYEEQKNMTAAEPYYQSANDHHHQYILATRGAIVVAAADVILTFIKGLRNVKEQKIARQNQGVSLRPGLQAGQPKLVLRYSF